MNQNPFRTALKNNQRNHSGFAQAAMSSLHQATPNGAKPNHNAGTARASGANNGNSNYA